MKRTISLLLVLSTISLLGAQDDDISASEPEIVYVNEPVKQATVKQADDVGQEAVAQESEEEPEAAGEQESEENSEVVYEEYD